MLEWIGSALGSAVSFIGDGLVSILSWLFSGIISVVTKVIQVAGGIFELIDALFGFFIGIKDSLLGLVGLFFPWVPADVLNVIGLGLFACFLAGLVHQLCGK